LLASPEPDNGGGEAERDRDRHFHAADLCGTRANGPTCRHVNAIRNLRSDDSLGVDEFDVQAAIPEIFRVATVRGTPWGRQIHDPFAPKNRG
jgi:hypothetical protein